MTYVQKSKRTELHAHRGPGGKCLRGEEKVMTRERTDWKRLAWEYEKYPGTMAPFHRHLCEAIARADLAGLERLRRAYPELVKLIKGE